MQFSKFLVFALSLLIGSILIVSMRIANTDKKLSDKAEGLFQIGRHLFYDSILSKNYDLACASCHQQRYSFGYYYELRNLTSDDQKILKRLGNRDIMPLINLSNSKSFLWDGTVKSLEEQVCKPVRNKLEFNNSWGEITRRINQSNAYSTAFHKIGFKTIDSNSIVQALVFFEKQLVSNTSKYDLYTKGALELTQSELNGLRLMQGKGNCLSCHVLSPDGRRHHSGIANNGFNPVGFNLSGKKQFKFIKIPQLRNWIYTAPYGHSGNFQWMESIINKYSSGLEDTIALDSRMAHYKPRGIGFSDLEKREIIAFLATLNDSLFINNPRFSNPFVK